jgi:hypothetical protein
MRHPAIVVVLAVASALAPRPAEARNRQREAAGWELRGVRVVSTGQTVAVPADPATGSPPGTLTTGYVLEGRARATKGTLVPQGTFRLTLSAFSPARDARKQKAGTWYVEGRFTLTEAGADPRVVRVRHNPHVVEGKIRAALPASPTGGQGNWSAKAFVAGARVADRSARRSRGSLTFDAARDGKLLLDLDLSAGSK